MSTVQSTNLAGVFVVERPVFNDERGFFRETFRKSELETACGFELEFMQGNHSRSQKNTLRGIHIAPWHKLVTVAQGKVQQVVVDTRPDSLTFKKYFSIELGEDNFKSVFVPAGCGNGFLVLSEVADYVYTTTQEWAPNLEKNLQWHDPEIAINWQNTNPDLSEKDKNSLSLKELLHD